jgi:hypothetical protein
MALSLLRSGEEVNKINHIRSFGERQGSAVAFRPDVNGIVVSS